MEGAQSPSRVTTALLRHGAWHLPRHSLYRKILDSTIGRRRMPESVESVGVSLVILSLVFLGAMLIRRWSRPLRAMFIPTAVIGGFLVLALGPEGVGRLTDGKGVFPTETFVVWKALPGLLINV